MIERICQKILDILEADSRLLAGGNAFAAGWTTVTREENGDTPAEGSINLFDKPYYDDAGSRRPAIYIGTRTIEATDALDFQTHSSGARLEYRILTIPLVIACQAPMLREARQQRNQLRRNVKVILLEQIVQSGYWYELFLPGGSGGATSERVWTSTTGAGSQQVAEGLAMLPVQCRYSWNVTAYA